MKNYIIIPATQTEGMEGYSAIAIPNTHQNIIETQRMFQALDDIRKIDPTISRITYENPMVDLLLFNDEMKPMFDTIHIAKLRDNFVDELIEEGDFKVNSPAVEISNYGIKIFYNAEYSKSQVFCDFTQEEFNELLRVN